MDSRDRAFASAATYGTLARILSIDALLARFSRTPIDKLQPWVRTVLRLGFWQLCFSRSVPPSAACDTSVDLARKFANAGAAGYVNAVLRSAARTPDVARFPEDEPSDAPAKRAASLSVRRSLPAWMAGRLISAYGPEADSLAAAFLEAPKTSVRTNSLKTTPARLSSRLAEEGVPNTPGGFMEEALSLDLSGHPVPRIPAFREGWFFVQDEAAMLVTQIADPKPGESVLDVCAAPGGKTTHLAERMANRGRIVAYDSQEGRIGLIRDNCARLGITCVETGVRDATEPAGERTLYDLVLVDVPCSGLGLLAKKPEIRLNMTEARADALPALQRNILAAAAGNVRPGGRLVYSTCTVLPEENAGMIDSFLADHPGLFVSDPFEGLIPERLAAIDPTLTVQARAGRIQLLPNRHGCDGFFIARLRRSSP
jgi:16S rRNA (cytosine967-C5)-methyltransferase